MELFVLALNVDLFAFAIVYGWFIVAKHGIRATTYMNIMQDIGRAMVIIHCLPPVTTTVS